MSAIRAALDAPRTADEIRKTDKAWIERTAEFSYIGEDDDTNCAPSVAEGFDLKRKMESPSGAFSTAHKGPYFDASSATHDAVEFGKTFNVPVLGLDNTVLYDPPTRAELARLEAAEAEVGRLRGGYELRVERYQDALWHCSHKQKCAGCPMDNRLMPGMCHAQAFDHEKHLHFPPAKCAQCGGEKRWCQNQQCENGEVGRTPGYCAVTQCNYRRPCPACQGKESHAD